MLSHLVMSDSFRPHGWGPPGSSVHGISEARILEWLPLPTPAAAAAKSLQSCPTPCNPMVCSLPGSSVPGDSPGRNTREGCCHALLQGIFPTQGSNPGLLHCRWILYHLSHQGSPEGELRWINDLPKKPRWMPLEPRSPNSDFRALFLCLIDI